MKRPIPLPEGILPVPDKKLKPIPKLSARANNAPKSPTTNGSHLKTVSTNGNDRKSPTSNGYRPKSPASTEHYSKPKTSIENRLKLLAAEKSSFTHVNRPKSPGTNENHFKAQMTNGSNRPKSPFSNGNNVCSPKIPEPDDRKSLSTNNETLKSTAADDIDRNILETNKEANDNEDKSKGSKFMKNKSKNLM